MQRIFLWSMVFILIGARVMAQDALVVQKARKPVTLSGVTRSQKTAIVSSEVPGRVVAINYDVGQAIGQAPVVKIDPTFIDFQIEQLRLNIQKLTVAEERARTSVAYLKKEFERVDKLHKGDRATEVKRDAAEHQYQQAEYEFQSLQIDRKQIQVNVKELQERKKRHTIFATKGWIVIEKRVEAGEMIAAGQPLAIIADYQNLIIRLAVSGEELTTLRKLPDTFSVRVEGNPSQAAINWVNPEFNEKTRKLFIELKLVDYTGEKRGGLNVELPIEIASPGLWVPKKAVSNRYANPSVLTVDNNLKINLIVMGESDDFFVAAENGRLKPGMRLQPAK